MDEWPEMAASCSGVLPSESGYVRRDGPPLVIRILYAPDMNLAARCSGDRLLLIPFGKSERAFSTRGMSPKQTAMFSGVCSPAKTSILESPQSSIQGFRMISLAPKN